MKYQVDCFNVFFLHVLPICHHGIQFISKSVILTLENRRVWEFFFFFFCLMQQFIVFCSNFGLLCHFLISGGYNIKTGPGCSIELMKFDMGGSAAVLGAAKALGQIKPLGVEVSH